MEITLRNVSCTAECAGEWLQSSRSWYMAVLNRVRLHFTYTYTFA
jgi:hypothetical protein